MIHTANMGGPSMRFIKVLSVAFMMLILILLFAACSGSEKYGNSPVAPSINDSDQPLMFGTGEESGRSILAAYDAVVDPIAKTFTVTPVNRESSYHLPLTSYYPNVLKITGYGWTPNFWADINLKHPFPGSGIDVFDPRVIAILPANPGVSFNYPTLNCIGNNSVVMEPDGYTKLFDSLGGSITGNTNPFKAYFQDQPFRIWSGMGVYQETQRWNMDVNGFGGPLKFKFVVDVSTNYPDTSQQILDNAPEPVDMDILIDSNLNPLGGSASLDITILDWQGLSRIGGVSVESPSLFNGSDNIPYSSSPSSYEYTFSGTITNELGAPGGDYGVLVGTWDNVSGIWLYDEVSVSVIGFNLEIVKTVSMPAYAHDVAVKNGYAFVGQYHLWQYSGLQVIDVDPPESAYIVKNAGGGSYSNDIFISGDYAYLADGNTGSNGSSVVNIFSINPPESTTCVGTWYKPDYPLGSWAAGVYAVGGFIYVADSEAGLEIIDATHPQNPYIIKSLDTPGEARGVFVVGGYAYVADGGSGLEIIDITPRESAHIVKTIDTPGWAEKVFVSGSYAYVADNDGGLQIIDVDPISSASIVSSIETSSAVDVKVVGGYAFVADFWGGLQIMDINPPESAFFVTFIPIPSETYGVDVEGNYAYLASWASGLQIVKLW